MSLEWWSAVATMPTPPELTVGDGEDDGNGDDGGADQNPEGREEVGVLIGHVRPCVADPQPDVDRVEEL